MEAILVPVSRKFVISFFYLKLSFASLESVCRTGYN